MQNNISKLDMNQTLPPTGIFDFHTFNETILEKVGSQAGNLSKSATPSSRTRRSSP
jgi:hypothetical protein